MGGRAPTPRDEPDQGKAQVGPGGRQTRGGRSSQGIVDGLNAGVSRQRRGELRSGSAAAPKFTTSRPVQHIPHLGREIGVAERLGDRDLPPAMMHMGVARVARRSSRRKAEAPSWGLGGTA